MKKKDGKILIIDDDNYIILSIRILLEQYYQDVRGINDPRQIPTAFDETSFDVVVLDMNFSTGETSGTDGIYWLEEILKISSQTCVIFITAYGGVDIAVQAIKLGAFDFVMKPWENEKLLSSVAAAHQLAKSNQQLEKLTHENNTLKEVLSAPKIEIIGQSAAMQQVFSSMEKVAATDANTLLLGENGTGKEVVAQRLHRMSKRSEQVFISVDTGAIAESLFESELFGHVKGAFTDAYQNRVGKVEGANGGTLFLDEIGNLPLALQAKLLKVLEDRQVVPVGSNQPVPVDIRLVCATNADIYDLVKKGLFRQDLLYRINTVEIKLPPLKEREGDIPLLANHFLDIYKAKYQKKGLYVPDYVIKKLGKHDWPGNIRELQHAIERAVIMSDGKQLHVQDFSLVSGQQESDNGVEDYDLEKLEKWAIAKAIQKHHGHLSNAAKELGLSRGALYRRMEKYEL